MFGPDSRPVNAHIIESDPESGSEYAPTVDSVPVSIEATGNLSPEPAAPQPPAVEPGATLVTGIKTGDVLPPSLVDRVVGGIGDIPEGPSVFDPAVENDYEGMEFRVAPAPAAPESIFDFSPGELANMNDGSSLGSLGSSLAPEEAKQEEHAVEEKGGEEVDMDLLDDDMDDMSSTEPPPDMDDMSSTEPPPSPPRPAPFVPPRPRVPRRIRDQQIRQRVQVHGRRNPLPGRGRLQPRRAPPPVVARRDVIVNPPGNPINPEVVRFYHQQSFEPRFVEDDMSKRYPYLFGPKGLYSNIACPYPCRVVNGACICPE